MPAGNPAGYGMGHNAYAAGQQQAQQVLGLKAPNPPKPRNAAVPATQPTRPAPQMPRPAPMPAMPTPPSAMVAGNAFSSMAQQGAMKNAAFSLSPNPEMRAVEGSKDSNVRQPPTNEDRKIATGIDPAFNYLTTPSESDPYTIPRMF